MRGLLATLRAALSEVAANPAALLAQAGAMALNDAVWVVFWLLFFRRVGSIKGWDGRSVLVLLAVLNTAGGITLGVLANARRVGHLAMAGDLDAVLTLPVPPLAHLLVRRIEATNLGDIAAGVVLFAMAGAPTPARTAVFAAVVVLSVVAMTGFLVLAGSLALFAGRDEGGELGFHALVLFGSYPVDVFAGVAKVLLDTVGPAAFVATVPARLVESFDAAPAAALAASAGTFALAGWAAFTLGLRRYAVGSVWRQG